MRLLNCFYSNKRKVSIAPEFIQKPHSTKSTAIMNEFLSAFSSPIPEDLPRLIHVLVISSANEIAIYPIKRNYMNAKNAVIHHIDPKAPLIDISEINSAQQHPFPKPLSPEGAHLIAAFYTMERNLRAISVRFTSLQPDLMPLSNSPCNLPSDELLPMIGIHPSTFTIHHPDLFARFSSFLRRLPTPQKMRLADRINQAFIERQYRGVNPCPEIGELLSQFGSIEWGIATRDGGVTRVSNARGSDPITLGQLIGKGSYGTVVVGTRSEGSTHAIKRLDVKNEVKLASLVSEIRLSQQVTHPNIVAITHAYIARDNPFYFSTYMVMTHYTNGTVSDYLICQTTSDQLKLGWICNITSAIESLHRNRIAHFDIKTSNILIRHDLTVALTDFGMAEAFETDQIPNPKRGTWECLPPEILDYELIDPKKWDMWTWGIAIHHIGSGSKMAIPRHCRNKEIVIRKHYSNLLDNFERRQQTITQVSPQLRPLVEHTLVENSQDRWSADDMMAYLQDPGPPHAGDETRPKLVS